MSYPILPMALVTFLAGASKERSELPTGPRNITVVAHHNERVWPMRFAVETDAHWGEVVESSVRLFSQQKVDTMTIIYPADDNSVDFGIILEGGRKPSFFEWQYKPVFNVRLAPDNIIASISKGAGVETLQGLLDRAAKDAPAFMIPAVNPAFKLAGSGQD